jgi:hypothetical protein
LRVAAVEANRAFGGHATMDAMIDPDARRPRSRVHLVRWALLPLAIVMLSAGACSGSTSVQASNSTEAATPAGGDLTAFCAQLATTGTDQPESFVGSAQHLADVARLAGNTPAAIRPQIEAYQAFPASGAVDPSKRDSNLTENWPPAVRKAIGEIQSYESTNC